MAELSVSSAPGGQNIASRIWEALTAPHSSIDTSDRRRRAYIASAVLFALVFCIGIFVLISFGINSIIPWLMVIAAYVMSRTRYFEQAVLLACTAYILAVVWAMMRVPDWSGVSPLSYLAWLVVPILLSGLLLPPRMTLLLSIVMSALVLVLRPLFLPSIPGATFGVAGGFVIMISALITLATFLQAFYFVRPQLREIQDAQREMERKNAALEKANRDVRDFSYIIAHDLRSPVVSMREFVREARYAVDALRPAVDRSKVSTQERPALDEALVTDLPEALDYIDTSAQRMERLIAEILRISRAGQHEVNAKAVNVKLLVEKLLVPVRHANPEIAITTTNLPEVFMTDPFILEESLNNMIDNAAKYVSADRKPVITISGTMTKEQLTVEVRDNGRGIAPEEHKSVLQAFRRAANAHDVSGSGVGLYYVQSLLGRLGGSISFTSELDSGSQFFLRIPVSDERG